MFYPLFAMTVLTALVFVLNLGLRIWSVAAKKVRARHFKLLGPDGSVPDFIQAGSRHMSNLFETPVLFYTVGVLAIVGNAETPLMIQLGWVYVVLRVIHAVIHMTYNHVLHRMLVFTASFVVILFMWVQMLLFQLHM
jgi:hypothetical protein